MADRTSLVTSKNIILSRLKVFFEELNKKYQSNTPGLEMDLIALYEEGLELFFSSSKNFNLKDYVYFTPGVPADPKEYNKLISLIQLYLQSIFSEIASLDRLVVSSFNSLLSEREQVLQIAKQTSNKIADYLLYADPSLGAGYFFGDSFNTTNFVETGSSLVETEECFHSIEEGSIFLPIEEEKIPEIKKVILNKRSNGTNGNNYQLNHSGHNAIEALFDQEPNTWFEYELVSSLESNTPLILDLTICLKENSVLNHININPINFGTPTVLEIETIETSKDGETYFSIKDDFPIKDFASNDEENVFELSSSSSNYSGQGYFSFLARKVQYIHIVFKQSSPYTIETSNGSQLRYAIGIRDINIIGRKFNETGSLVSSSFSSQKEIKKVSLLASENPNQKSTLADVSHFISYNDGAKWIQIQPQGRDDFDIPEIISFNLGKNSLSTEEEVFSLRHKISLNRDKQAFLGDVILQEEKTSKLEIVNFPAQSENSFVLTELPIKNSIKGLLPFYGSYSCPVESSGEEIAGGSVVMDLDPIEIIVDVPGTQVVQTESGFYNEGIIKFPLPFKGINHLEKKIRVFLNGSQIEYCSKDESKFINGSNTSYSEINYDSKVYFLNKGGKELQFGYKGSDKIQYGFVPASGSKLSLYLDGDNPYLELFEGQYHLVLSSLSDGDKETMNLLATDSLESDNYSEYELVIPPGVSSYRAEIMRDSLGETLSSEYTTGSGLLEEPIGTFLPYFILGTDNFELKEYDLEENLIADSEKDFRNKVEYIDGYTELHDVLFHNISSRYTFNPETGTVYLGKKTDPNRRYVLVAKNINIEKIPSSSWSFYRNNISNQIDSGRIVLDPLYVYTNKQKTEILIEDQNQRSVDLLLDNEKTHSWHNKKLVKRTVKPSTSLFSNEYKPTEVSYINGQKEFDSIKEIKKELITFVENESGYLDFSLSEISSLSQTLTGSPTFSAVRSEIVTLSPVNIFNINGQKETFNDLSTATSGDWAMERSGVTYTIRVKYSGTPKSHTVSYKYEDSEIGINTSNFYSIDYQNAIIYFASPIRSNGYVEYEISQYSAFYNIGKEIPSDKIVSVEDKTVSFDPEFLLTFLKEKTYKKNIPDIIKVDYSYNKTITESLADLEPYFSPICKDLAFRMVDSSLIEEL